MNILAIATAVIEALPLDPPKDIEPIVARFPDDEQDVVRRELRHAREFYEPVAVAAEVIAANLRSRAIGEEASAYHAAAFVYTELAWAGRYFGCDDVAVSVATASRALSVGPRVAEQALESAIKLGLIRRVRLKNKETYHPLPLGQDGATATTT